MKHSKFRLVNTTCPRCGKPTMTGNRSLWGADQLKAKYSGICSSCTTPEEKQEILNSLALSVHATLRGTVK